MPYTRCFYHIVWATKYRQQLITPAYEQLIRSAITAKCSELHCKLLALNMVADHVHLAITMPPSLSISVAVKQLKGASSREINVAINPDVRFFWQEGYGAHTFSERGLSTVQDYIARQKEHHAQGTAIAGLEQTEEQ